MSEASGTAPRTPTDGVDVGTPFYQDGQLQVHVYWQSRAGAYDTSVNSSTIFLFVYLSGVIRLQTWTREIRLGSLFLAT